MNSEYDDEDQPKKKKKDSESDESDSKFYEQMEQNIYLENMGQLQKGIDINHIGKIEALDEDLRD